MEGPTGSGAVERLSRAPGVLWLALPLISSLILQVIHATLDRAPDFDEASYMALARNIVRTGTLLDPAYPGGRIFLAHPPLFYFLVAGSFALFGPGLLAGRAVSSLLSLATLLIVFALIRRERGSEWAAAGALLVGVNPAFLYYADSVYMEMTAAFLVTGALRAFARAGERKTPRAFLVPGVWLGLACVTKYYCAIPVMVASVLLAMGGERQTRIRRLAFFLAPVVAAGVVWSLYGLYYGGYRFVTSQIGWMTPDMARAEFSWRNVSNWTFLKELIGVVTPAFAVLGLTGVVAAVTRTWRGRGAFTQSLLWLFPVAYTAFLLVFREKDIKYVVPMVPALGVLAALAVPGGLARLGPRLGRWAATLAVVALASPLLPLYDPTGGGWHDNLLVFGIRRDPEYRLYQAAGRIAASNSAPGDYILSERKAPIIGFYADRPFLDTWGLSPERIRPFLSIPRVVVLDRKAEYLSAAEWEEVRKDVDREFEWIASLPEERNPTLLLYRRR